MQLHFVLTLNLECLVFSFPSFSEELVDGRDLVRCGVGDVARGAGDDERLVEWASPVGEPGVEDVGNGVVPFRPGGGEFGGA